MVKVTKKNKGRSGWNATVQAIAKSANAELPPGLSAPKRRETRKRAAKSKKARWIEEFEGDTTELGAWARLDVLLDAPAESTHAAAFAEDDADDADYREVDSDADEEDAEPAKGRRGPKRKKRARSPKPTKRAKTADDEAAAARERRARGVPL